MTDTDLLRAAINASGLSARRWAEDVLGVDERTVRRWSSEDRTIPPTVLIICDAIVRRPALAKELARARARVIAA